MTLTLQQSNSIVQLSRHIIVLVGTDDDIQSGVESRIMGPDECDVLQSKTPLWKYPIRTVTKLGVSVAQ